MKRESNRRPNLVLVMTDDQGYGDLGCTGNPWIKTPNIDRFHDQSVRLADFHVSPLCTPTRGAIMSGHYPLRNGAWATCWGRSILRRDELTLADAFASSGYRTGMFGKWHLGDNYPYRPHDRGFQKAVYHRGGGIGNTGDYWGNSYFDDVYFHNGEPVTHEGYCTDVWFDEALSFIEENKDRPFFCYLSTNAPHAPYLVDEHYTAPYRGNQDIPNPSFYGMITNIDENFGRLRAKLDELGLTDDTVLIYMTDNGSSGGCELDDEQHVTNGYNAGMRGKKASYYDGGHRVPFFVRWPGGGLDSPREVDALCSHVDLFPTFIDLCALRPSRDVTFDGVSLAPLLRGEAADVPERPIFVQYRQSTELPEKWCNAVLSGRWRLVHGTELYDVKTDPCQRRDVAAYRPELVANLRSSHEAYWDEVWPRMQQFCPISLGNEAENPTLLCSMDVLGEVAWNQQHVRTGAHSTGRWAVDVEQKGTYRFSLRRWPVERDLAIWADLPQEEADCLAPYYCGMGRPSRTIRATHATLRIHDHEETVEVPRDALEAAFTVELSETGPTRVEAWFTEEDGTERGVYYVYVERLPRSGGAKPVVAALVSAAACAATASVQVAPGLLGTLGTGRLVSGCGGAIALWGLSRCASRLLEKGRGRRDWSGAIDPDVLLEAIPAAAQLLLLARTLY